MAGAMRLFSHRKRPVHLGPFPLERLPRASAVAGALTGAQPEVSPPPGAKEPVEPDRAAGIWAYAAAEPPDAARARIGCARL
jgi:hypothetical protein